MERHDRLAAAVLAGAVVGAVLPGVARAGDLGHALHYIADQTSPSEIEGWEDRVERPGGTLHALIEARDAPEDKPVEAFDCSESRIDSFWTLTPDYLQNRYVARFCFEAQWAKDSLPGYRTLGRVRLTQRGVEAWVDEAARVSGLDTILIDTVIRFVSGYRPGVVSDRGELGLMQITAETARRFGAKDPMNPRQNVIAGARYLAHLLERWGSLEFALAAYRGGEAAIHEADGMPTDKRTLFFAREVRNIHRIMTEPFPEAEGWEHVTLVAGWLH
jgi:hypothetical protein